MSAPPRIYRTRRERERERDFFNIKAGGTLSVSRTHKKKEIERVPKKMEGEVER